MQGQLIFIYKQGVEEMSHNDGKDQKFSDCHFHGGYAELMFQYCEKNAKK
jgi:hypothetical protein